MAKAKRKTKAQKMQRRSNVTAAPASASAPEEELSAAPVVRAVPGGAPAVTLAPSDLKRAAYVATDVRRIAMMTVTFIALQLALSYVLNHTGFGDSVYNSIHVG